MIQIFAFLSGSLLRGVDVYTFPIAAPFLPNARFT